MQAEQFVADPVFQLNLLVWMAVEQMARCFRVRPVFHERGFELLYIEQPFPFPPETRNAIEAAAAKAKLRRNRLPNADYLLNRA